MCGKVRDVFEKRSRAAFHDFSVVLRRQLSTAKNLWMDLNEFPYTPPALLTPPPALPETVLLLRVDCSVPDVILQRGLRGVVQKKTSFRVKT